MVTITVCALPDSAETVAVGGVRRRLSTTIRSGCFCAKLEWAIGNRAVSDGSSDHRPHPDDDGIDLERSRWTSCRARGPVIQFASPFAVATFPSSVIPALRMTYGRFVRCPVAIRVIQRFRLPSCNAGRQPYPARRRQQSLGR